MPFWRRKKDEFVSLGLNTPAAPEPGTPAAPEPGTAPPPATSSTPAVAIEPSTAPEMSRTPIGGANTGRMPALPAEGGNATVREGADVGKMPALPEPVKSQPSTPWQTSVLGL